MTRAARIRAWLTANASEESPRTMPDIRAALGLSKAACNSTLGDLKRAGYVATSGACRAMGYWRTDKIGAIPGARTPEQLLADERARAAKRRKDAGCRTRAEWKAETTAKREAVRRDKALQRAQQAVKRLKQAQAKPCKPVARAARKTPLLRMTTPVTIAPPKPKAETVAEWQARTGSTPQLLARGEVSPANRLKGHDLLTDESWNNRRRT